MRREAETEKSGNWERGRKLEKSSNSGRKLKISLPQCMGEGVGVASSVWRSRAQKAVSPGTRGR